MPKKRKAQGFSTQGFDVAIFVGDEISLSSKK